MLEKIKKIAKKAEPVPLPLPQPKTRSAIIIAREELNPFFGLYGVIAGVKLVTPPQIVGKVPGDVVPNPKNLEERPCFSVNFMNPNGDIKAYIPMTDYPEHYAIIGQEIN